MIDLLIIVVRWLAAFRSGGDVLARRERFLPPVRAVCGWDRGDARAIGALGDIGWMTVRLDLRSCVPVLSGVASARRDPVTRRIPPRGGGA
jgi:hypothetical protein